LDWREAQNLTPSVKNFGGLQKQRKRIDTIRNYPRSLVTRDQWPWGGAQLKGEKEDEFPQEIKKEDLTINPWDAEQKTTDFVKKRTGKEKICTHVGGTGNQKFTQTHENAKSGDG